MNKIDMSNIYRNILPIINDLLLIISMIIIAGIAFEDFCNHDYGSIFAMLIGVIFAELWTRYESRKKGNK